MDDASANDEMIARILGEEIEEASLAQQQQAEDAKLASLMQEENQLRIEVADRAVALDMEILQRLGGFERRPLVLQRVMRHKSVLSAEEDEFVQRHLRIQTLLAKNGLRERVIRGDGNCQFSALSDQLYHTPAYHKHVRKYVIYHLVRNPDAYMHFVCGESWTAYLKRMAKPGEWGDHLTLQAAANVYGIQINLLTSYAEQAYIEVQPKVRCSERILWLTFMAEVHYNSIKTVGEPDRPEFDERVRCSIS